ncbi:dTMP kinase [Micromonospora sp. Llam0]|uniref:thymidylate kinase n=1 Tax=Micromonospora sp. Llam0 TaxID=2485143 RepID=UPI000F49BFD7|nr:thymidylate kinase [Micromonospora sp. Llam0]ROO51623.1 dTMP kinase [Micromonospora sp. Llam0]
MSGEPRDRGRLVSIEGLSGVGKTYLTNRLLENYPSELRPALLEEFSQRPRSGVDLGRELLGALISAADGDPFLRGGHCGTETLLLLAIKMFDYEAGSAATLATGRTVIEGRSVHSIAVYQSLIAHRDDEAAYRHAGAILRLAATWRPLPDLTILIVDDVVEAVRRAEQRDGRHYTPEQWRLHRRAAALFDRLAADAGSRIVVLDRRRLTMGRAIERMAQLIDAA